MTSIRLKTVRSFDSCRVRNKVVGTAPPQKESVYACRGLSAKKLGNFYGEYWAGTIEVLRNEGFRVIVPDRIGYGRSSKPAQASPRRPPK